MENRNQSEKTPESAYLSKWGMYTGNHDWVDLDQHHVISGSLMNNPPIKSAHVLMNGNTDMNWVADGQCLEKTTSLRHLYLCFLRGCSDDNLRSFCQGLALNRSLRALEIKGNKRDCVEEIFYSLLPFFRCNNNLVCLRISLGGEIPTSLRRGIEAAPSLRAVHLEVHSWDTNLEGAILVICRKPGLNHIAINGCSFSRNACLEIHNMLCNERCDLKSLTLTHVHVSQVEDIPLISSGLAKNKSLKCLRFHTCKDEIMLSFLESIKHAKLNSLEELDLGDNQTLMDKSLMAAVVQQLPMLKMLNLNNTRFSPSVLKILLPIFTSCQLHELHLSNASINDEALQVLAAGLSANNSLKKLILSRNYDISTTGWCNFFTSVRTRTLEENELMKVAEDSIVTALSHFVKSNGGVKLLKIPYWVSDSSSRSRRNLAFILESPISIEIEELEISATSRNWGSRLANQFALNSKITMLQINITDADHVQAMAMLQRIITSTIQLPNCATKELAIRYEPLATDEAPVVHRDRERSQLTQILVNALQRNSSVKVLRFLYGTHRRFEFDWSLFSNLLCNKSSFDATYSSNHTLQSIVLPVYKPPAIPEEVVSLLRTNRDSTKYIVTRDKIVRNHRIADLDFISPSLPVVLSCVGNSRSRRGLPQMYDILRKHPHVIQNN